MGYGINVWTNISTTNDSITVNSHNSTLAVNSSSGSNIVMNGNLAAQYNNILIEGDLTNAGDSTMVNISGTIYHDYDKFAIKGKNKTDGSVCYHGVNNVNTVVALYVKKF